MPATAAKSVSSAIETPESKETGAGSQQDQRPAVAPAATENVDRIREIIFGPQMRDYEVRFARVEERLLRESADLKEELKRRWDALETYTRQEIESLVGRLSDERAERTDSLERLAQELSELAKSVDRRGRQAEELNAKQFRDLRQMVLATQEGVIGEVRQKTTDLAAVLGREIGEVRGDKLDRSVIANLFTEVAMRIKGESLMPQPAELKSGGTGD